MVDTENAPDLRDTLSAAFDEAEKATEAPAPAMEAAPAGAVVEDVPAADTHARDEQGRFAPKPPEPKAKASVERKTETGGKASPADSPVSATLPPPAQAPVPSVKAPQSWTPAEREEFSKLPKVAQEAVLRRESEHAKFVQESAEHRNGFQQFQKVIAPYEGLIRSRGGEPVQVVDAAVRAYVGLHTSPPQVQAQMVANMVRGLNIPIDVLDRVLAGEASQAPAQQQPQFNEAAMEARMMERFEKQRVAQEVGAWREGKEFFDDVAPTMEGLLMAASNAKKSMTLDQAYEQACRAHPEISTVLEGRKAEETKKTREAELQQKRIASTSVRSSPAGRMNGGASPKSVVDYVSKAWDMQEGV